MFVINFLRSLHDEGLIRFNLSLGRFEYRIEQIQIHAMSGDFAGVTQYLMRRMTRLDHKFQLALKVASCFGFVVDARVLRPAAAGLGIDRSVLDEIVAMGFLQGVGSNYVWSHDTVQQAAYALIDTEEMKSFHLLIGLRLLLKTAPDELEERVFDIVRHMNIRSELLRTKEQKDEIARLNMIAGERAIKSSAFSSAATYVLAAISLSSEDGEYDFLIRCYHLAMDPLHAIGDFSTLEMIIEKTFSLSKSFEEKLKAYQYLIRLLSASGKPKGKLASLHMPIDHGI